MICFNCGMRIYKGDNKECRICGVKFANKCQVCGSPNPAMANFCMNCSARLTKTDSQRLLRDIDLLHESRRNVAVIFADISGFTALSEKLDPEDVREIVNDCFNYITKPVYEMGGTIDKYIGDCVMILFGAKYSHSDDVKRAVICAMKMMKLIREFSDNNISLRGFSLSLSIGINYGLVVTGEVGNYYDKDYTVMGDIVNTAQRLQSNAGEGVILVSESVFSETSDMVEYSSMKEVKVKNKENPVRCYQPLNLNKDYLIKREELFVGREDELSLFNTIYNDALNSSIQCVILTGEGGSGKTRLIKEFVSKVDNNVKKIWVDCNHLFQNRAYYVITSILERIMNISPSDSSNVKQHRLISFLSYILYDSKDQEIQRCYNFLGMIMGLEKDTDFTKTLESMSFNKINGEILKCLLLFFNGVRRKNKVIVIVEDLQWVDSISLRLLKRLMELLCGTGIIFILSSRYKKEELTEFNRKGVFHHINLDGLGLVDMKNLTNALLDCKWVDQDLMNTIAKFTRGNPLYIKELLSSIKRTDKLLVSDGKASIIKGKVVCFPDGISNLILSKLSDLSDRTRTILHAASVIGREFDLSLLSYILGYQITQEDITDLTAQLDIIRLKNPYTSNKMEEKVFVFIHDVEREVIYDSILNREKKIFHEKIGEYMENIHAKDIEDYHKIADFHFHKAGL